MFPAINQELALVKQEFWLEASINSQSFQCIYSQTAEPWEKKEEELLKTPQSNITIRLHHLGPKAYVLIIRRIMTFWNKWQEQQGKEVRQRAMQNCIRARDYHSAVLICYMMPILFNYISVISNVVFYGSWVTLILQCLNLILFLLNNSMSFL